MKNIVVIGGGTGTHTIIGGLKKYVPDVNLKVIVTMADSGGSTGRLRDEFGYLPVGDVRMALAALADEDEITGRLLRSLFLHRFEKGEGLSGHNFGNLFLVALTDILNSEEEAIRVASHVLRVKGEVLPVTTEKVDLVAEYEDGVVVRGETLIDEPHGYRDQKRIMKLYTEPEGKITESAKTAIAEADVIILGPGDLYTSVLANCVVGGVREALAASKAIVIHVSNLMTKFGQTSGMGVKEHILELEKYAARKPDIVFVNTAPFPKELLKRYEEQGEQPVVDNANGAFQTIRGDFLAEEEVITEKGDVLKRSLIRHDKDKLAAAIMQYI